MTSPEAESARSLLTAAAVRERSHRLLDHGLAGGLSHFTVDLGRLDLCADEVVATIRSNYPTLDIPFHARWRHFQAGGHDRWGAVAEAVDWDSAEHLARAAFDLAVVSVLLDAGAGPAWAYEEGRTGEVYARSEGLAVASFDMFVSGTFSARPEDPFRVDAETLLGLTPEELAQGFQVSDANPLVGLEGRAGLLQRLGRRMLAAPDLFGEEGRPGGLFDRLAEEGGVVPAPRILEAVLEGLGPIWPGRIQLGGVDLGDAWRHPLAGGAGETAGIVPFHKLSQWLSYSLIEPLEGAGITVGEVDGLTGLPEYRNGGLFLDTGVIALKNPSDAARPHEVGSPLVVEWRALTVALLDRVAEPIREKLGLKSADFPLAKILEGGTWATGRRLAAARHGAPPLSVVSDGTVF